MVWLEIYTEAVSNEAIKLRGLVPVQDGNIWRT